jgi:hypothetical protein
VHGIAQSLGRELMSAQDYLALIGATPAAQLAVAAGRRR